MTTIESWLKKELGPTYEEPVPPVSKEKMASGKAIYMKSCAPCHGETGRGNGPDASALEHKPANFTDPGHANRYSDRGRLHIIKKGIPGTPMPAWENALSDNQIHWVYAYIRSLRPGGHEEPHTHKTRH